MCLPGEEAVESGKTGIITLQFKLTLLDFLTDKALSEHRLIDEVVADLVQRGLEAERKERPSMIRTKERR
jgi:hypothetical protein